MSFETLANTIRRRFESEIVGMSGLAVAYDNAPFDPPENTTWVRFTVLPGDTVQKSIGAAKRFRTPGIAVAQIFLQVNTGDKEALALSDKINLAFRAKSIRGVTFTTPSLRRVGRTGNWYQVNVICPFYADEIEGV